MQAQRKSTNSALDVLKRAISRNKDSLKGFDLQAGFDALSLLDSTRSNADKSINSDSPLIVNTIGYYTKTIGTLLDNSKIHKPNQRFLYFAANV